jgi:hypothetical protein
MTGISVTTKHGKRLYANPLFAVSYGSFLRGPLHVLTLVIEFNRDSSPTTQSAFFNTQRSVGLLSIQSLVDISTECGEGGIG